LSSTIVSDIAVWRYSHFPEKTFAALKNAVDDNPKWASTILDVLRTRDVSTFIRTLEGFQNDDFIQGSISRLLKASDSKQFSITTLKRLDYITQLLLSSVFRNDTGKKGSLSLVPLSGSDLALPFDNVKVIYPERNSSNFHTILPISRIHNNEKNAARRSALGRALHETVVGNLYEFEICLKERLNLSNDTRNRITKNTEQIGRTLVEKSRLLSSDQKQVIVAFCVDYFLREHDVEVLEVHCPPRGIGVMYSGFRPFFPESEFPVDTLAKTVKDLFKHAKGKNLERVLIVDSKPDSAFFGMDIEMLETAFKDQGIQLIEIVDAFQFKQAAKESSPVIFGHMPEMIYFTDLPVSFFQGILSQRLMVVPAVEAMRLAYDRMLIREFEPHGPKPPKGVAIRKEGASLDIEALRKQIGDWVVVKPIINEPWWFPSKKRTAFLCLGNMYHQKLLSKLVLAGDVVVEELVTDSLDSDGFFGELRVFGVASNQGYLN
jgi:hypothetical protein